MTIPSDLRAALDAILGAKQVAALLNPPGQGVKPLLEAAALRAFRDGRAEDAYVARIRQGLEDAERATRADYAFYHGPLREPLPDNARAAYFTCCDPGSEEPLYYFAPINREAPYRQREVEAVIDIAADGTLAGIELIDRMPPPPGQPQILATEGTGTGHG